MSKIYESIWADMHRVSTGEQIRKEDDVNHMDFDTFAKYIEDTYSENSDWFTVVESLDNKTRHIQIDVISGITLSFNVIDGKLYNILVEGVPGHIDIQALKGIFNVNILGSGTVSVVEKDWTKSNNTFIKLIEFFLNMKTNESIWVDMHKISTGETTKKEDDINNLDWDGFYDYLTSIYKSTYVNYNIKGNKLNIDIPIFLGKHVTDLIIEPNMRFCSLSIHKDDISPDLKKELELKYKVYYDYVEKGWYNINIFPKEENEDIKANSFYIELIDYILDMDKEQNNMIEKVVNESVWADMHRVSTGENIRKEDEELNKDELKYLSNLAKMFDFAVQYVDDSDDYYYSDKKEDFIKYIEARRDELFWSDVEPETYDKIIEFVNDNWGDCKCIKDFVGLYSLEECEGVPGGATPANVGGMGAAYFPGPNGEPGSGDLPSPTGIVYQQVAPFTTFIKQGKKKKKKKKFRKEDEPCVHSPNAKVYDYVDDFREYVDRTYNNMDRK